MRSIALAAFAISLAACRSHPTAQVDAHRRTTAVVADVAPPPQPALRVHDVLAQRATLLGRHVVVDLYETLRDATEDSATGSGALLVDVVDESETLRLVASDRATAFEDAQRRRLEGPMRIEGVLREGDVDALPRGVAIAVERVEPLSVPTPVDIGACESITHADAGIWNGRFIRCEGLWHQRMEASSLDGTWMDVARYAVIENYPDAARDPAGMSYPVRVTGLVDARPEGRYGHMGRFRASILGTHIEYTGQPLTPMELWRVRARRDGGFFQQLGARPHP